MAALRALPSFLLSRVLLRGCRSFSSSSSSSHRSRTVAVPERIQEKRRAALLGGGQARIDAQHKRVSASFPVTAGERSCSLACRFSDFRGNFWPWPVLRGCHLRTIEKSWPIVLPPPCCNSSCPPAEVEKNPTPSTAIAADFSIAVMIGIVSLVFSI